MLFIKIRIQALQDFGAVRTFTKLGRKAEWISSSLEKQGKK